MDSEKLSTAGNSAYKNSQIFRNYFLILFSIGHYLKLPPN